MIVYLAGKITGDPEYRGKFRAAARKITRCMGARVISPAELPEGMKPEDYMQICLSMLGRADAAAFLPDWKASDEARLEREYCTYVGKPVMDLEG
jgi:hypothetical protein